jgi:hypothetical protein
MSDIHIGEEGLASISHDGTPVTGVDEGASNAPEGGAGGEFSLNKTLMPSRFLMGNFFSLFCLPSRLLFLECI